MLDLNQLATKLGVNPPGFAQNVLVHDRFGQRLWSNILDEYKNIQDIEKIDERALPLTQDIFIALYNSDYKKRNLSEMKGEYKINHKVFSNLEEDLEFQKLKADCYLDTVLSALSSASLSQKVVDELKADQEIRDNLDDIKETEQDLMSALMQGDEEVAEQALKKLADLDQSLQNQLQQKQSLVRRVLHKSVEQVQQEAEEIKEALQATGVSRTDFSQENTKTDLRQSLQYAQKIKNNPRLKKMLTLLGKMKRVASKVKQTKGISVNIPDGVELGNNLPRVLPSEYLWLHAHQGLFGKKYAERQLVQRKYKQNPQGKGPIVILLDQSGSMNGERDIVAKAISLGIIETVSKEKRKLLIIPFSTEVIAIHEITPETLADKIIEIFSDSPTGGTDIMPPIKKGLKIIKNTIEFNRADILLITDEEIHLRDEEISFIKENKENIFFTAVVIEAQGGKILKQFCDDVITIAELNAENAAEVAEKIYMKL